MTEYYVPDCTTYNLPSGLNDKMALENAVEKNVYLSVFH